MRPENLKIEKKHVSNSNLAKTEKWLRDQAKLGWKLSKVTSNVFYNTFLFVKSTPCDDVYFAPASFPKMPKFESISYGAIQHIKNAYSGKPVQGEQLAWWIHFKMQNITDAEDVRKHLQYRENCIRKEYLLDFVFFIISAVALFAVGLFAKAIYSFYSLPILMFAISVWSLMKLVVHNRNCKKAYADF